MTTNLDLDALEALAKAATPGPWGLDQMGEDEPEVNMWADLFVSTIEPDAGGVHHVVARPEDGHGPTAQFIAAADPSTILALIAELRQERERADGEAHDARHLRSVRDDLRADRDRDRDRLHKAITEAVEILTRGDNADPAGEAWRILRAALEQKGNDDE